MSLYLTIDRGNTEAKIALWNGIQLVESLVDPRVTVESLHKLLGDRVPDAAIYSSVAADDDGICEALSSVCSRILRLRCGLPLPIEIGYATPETLGPDRIAAAVGAWSRFPGLPVLVVDAGTAVTFDYVSPEGTFISGNIAPGISMQLEALHRFTARLPLVPFPENPTADYGDRILGTDTPSAISLGVLYSIVGAMAFYRTRLPQDTRVVLGGGCARILAPLCDFPVEVDTHLASKGLNRILLYNENK